MFPCFFDGIGISFRKIKKGIGIGFEKNLVSEKVSDSVSKNSGIEKSIGIGIGKNLVSKKFGIGKKFRIRFRSDFGYRHTLDSRYLKVVNPSVWCQSE